MTSWTTCRSRSHRLSPVCHDLASPSTSPPSSSMASLSSTTDSVSFSWVKMNYLVYCQRFWGRRCWVKCVCSWSRVLPEELQSVVGQLVKQRTSQKIDIDDQSRWEQLLTHLFEPMTQNYSRSSPLRLLLSLRQSLENPDALSFLEETEGAPDPLFGVMYMKDAMPSPTKLIEVRQYARKESNVVKIQLDILWTW